MILVYFIKMVLCSLQLFDFRRRFILYNINNSVCIILVFYSELVLFIYGKFTYYTKYVFYFCKGYIERKREREKEPRGRIPAQEMTTEGVGAPSPHHNTIHTRTYYIQYHLPQHCILLFMYIIYCRYYVSKIVR